MNAPLRARLGGIERYYKWSLETCEANIVVCGSILLLNKLQTWTWTLIEGNCRKRGLAAKRENGGRNVYGYISSCSGFASV